MHPAPHTPQRPAAGIPPLPFAGACPRQAADGRTALLPALSQDARAVLLLCAPLAPRPQQNGPRPLSAGEYNACARALAALGARPCDLLAKGLAAEAARASGIAEARLCALLGRGEQLDCALDAWRRHGLWVLCRGDATYPSRLRLHLQTQAPALLFGAGDPSLLDAGGLAIVGSRKIDAQAKAFAVRAARDCAASGIAVVSGGARGTDSIAMTAALDAQGRAVGVLADSLLARSLARQAQSAIACGRLLLLSPWHPQAPFAAWAALGRNKLIYALADCALAVSAEWRKGGTWAGAEEELRRKHARPVFVRTGPEAPEGNAALLGIGAIPWPKEPAGGSCQGAGSPDLRTRLREAFARAQAGKKGRRKAVQASLAGIIEAERARTCA